MLRIIPIFIMVAVFTHVCVAQNTSDFLSIFKGYKNNTIHLDAKITVQDLTPEPDKFNRTHSLNSYFSLVDPRVVLDFSNISLKMTYPDKSTQIVKLKEKFTFDGQNWRTYSYSKNDGNKTYPINTMVISETPPTFLKHFLTIYSGKSFFCNYFKFFETSKETLTVLSILNTKPVFPPLEIKTKENEIEIFGEIANYVWKCKIIKYKTSPLLRYYYYQNGDGYTVTYNTEGIIQILNTPLYIPKKMERVIWFNKKNQGFKIIMEIKLAELLTNFDFDKCNETPQAGWSIIDKNKNIFYQQGETSEDILKTLNLIK